MKVVEIAKKIYHIKDREWKLFFKENKKNDEVIYVVRFFPKEGLMSMLYKTLRQVEYAVSKGWVPYVDTQHFSNMYKVKGVNSWECFFTQPKVPCEKKKYRKYVIGNPGKHGTECFTEYWASAFNNYDKKNALLNKYIAIDNAIEKKVDEYAEKLQLSTCVGVLCRGTDYVSLKPKGHPIQPSVDEVAAVIDKFLEEEDSRIFLVTEDSKIKAAISEQYKGKIITIDEDVVFEKYHEGKMLADSIGGQDKIRVASVYLIKILCLARCKRLIASKTNGSLMALILNGGGGYIQTHVFDKGFY